MSVNVKLEQELKDKVEELKVSLKKLGKSIARIPVAIGGMIYNGYALATVYSWIIVAQFGVAPLSVAAAVGINLIVNYFLEKKNKEAMFKEKTVEGHDWEYTIISGYIYPTAFLGLGYIVSKFI